MFDESSIQGGFALQLYRALVNEQITANSWVNYWTTLNTALLISTALLGLLVATLAPLITEKRRALKALVVALGFTGACLTTAGGLFHPASTAQRYENIVFELEQAMAQYNEEFHNLQPGPSFDRDELALRDKYATFQTQIAGEMNSIHLSFGTLDTQQPAKIPVTVPPVTVQPPPH